MLSNKNQAQVYGAIERKGNSYHVNFYLRVSSRFANFFTAQNPAPARVAAQLACFNAAIAAEDGFFKISTKSDLTPLIQEWDTKRDNNTSSLRAMAQAFALDMQALRTTTTMRTKAARLCSSVRPSTAQLPTLPPLLTSAPRHSTKD